MKIGMPVHLQNGHSDVRRIANSRRRVRVEAKHLPLIRLSDLDATRPELYLTLLYAHLRRHQL